MKVLDTRAWKTVQSVLLLPEAVSRANASMERNRVLNSVFIVDPLESYSSGKRLRLGLIQIA
jgi:hypothetical protein